MKRRCNCEAKEMPLDYNDKLDYTKYVKSVKKAIRHYWNFDVKADTAYHQLIITGADDTIDDRLPGELFHIMWKLGFRCDLVLTNLWSDRLEAHFTRRKYARSLTK